jgi:PKD repeat protein
MRLPSIERLGLAEEACMGWFRPLALATVSFVVVSCSGSPVIGPTIESFTATPDAIAPGEVSTLAWSVRGTDPIELAIDQGVGTVTGEEGAQVAPEKTTVYTLTASNATGSDSASVTVTVTVPGEASWRLLGGALNVHADWAAYYPSMALAADGSPVVAWVEESGAARSVYVKRWTGSAWEALGGALNPMAGAGRPALALDASGDPVVAWSDANGAEEQFFVLNVDAWTGSGWRFLGSPVSRPIVGDEAIDLALVLDLDERPVVAWHHERTIYVHRWTGSVWLLVGGELDAGWSSYGAAPRIAMDSHGRPLVAWEADGFIHVWRLGRDGWRPLDGPLSEFGDGGAAVPSLAVDRGPQIDGGVVVAWEEWDTVATTNRVFVKYWNGSEWLAVGGMLNSSADSNAFAPALALGDDHGLPVPVVAFSESGSPLGPPLEPAVLVKRWTGTVWEPVAGVLNVDEAEAARHPALALSASGDPVVAWSEDGSIYVRRYSVLP